MPVPANPPGSLPTPNSVGGASMGGAFNAPGQPGGMVSSILAKLNNIVAVNQLQRFYSPQGLQALAAKLDSRVNFRDLAAR